MTPLRSPAALRYRDTKGHCESSKEYCLDRWKNYEERNSCLPRGGAASCWSLFSGVTMLPGLPLFNPPVAGRAGAVPLQCADRVNQQSAGWALQRLPVWLAKCGKIVHICLKNRISIISLDFEVLLLNRERKWPRNYKIDRGPVEVRGVVHCCS